MKPTTTSGRIAIEVKGHVPVEEMETSIFAEIGKLFVDYDDTVLRLVNGSARALTPFPAKDTYVLHLDISEASTASMMRLASAINGIEDVVGVVNTYGSIFFPVFDIYGFEDGKASILNIIRSDIGERFNAAISNAAVS